MRPKEQGKAKQRTRRAGGAPQKVPGGFDRALYVRVNETVSAELERLTAAKSKADLLQLVVDTVVAGDDEPVQITDRDPFQAIGDEPDPVRQVEMIAALIASTQERSASVQVVFRQAAAVDDTIADNLDAELQRRHATFVTIIGMIPEEHLRHSREESADLAWAIGSSEVFLLLRRRRGWDADHYVRTLTDVLVHQLLVPDRVS